MEALFDAHARLATCRAPNGDIPWTAIDDYARRHRIEDFEFLEDCIYGLEKVRRAVKKQIADQEAAFAQPNKDRVH